MVLDEEVKARLLEVIHQHKQRDLLVSHGLVPKRKFLFWSAWVRQDHDGLGASKGMRTSALSIPAYSLITKFMGETAAKLHLVFEAMIQQSGVYLVMNSMP